jgi:hypothetical protein
LEIWMTMTQIRVRRVMPILMRRTSSSLFAGAETYEICGVHGARVGNGLTHDAMYTRHDDGFLEGGSLTIAGGFRDPWSELCPTKPQPHYLQPDFKFM